MSRTTKLTGIYTLLHFFVDFTTIFLLNGLMLGPESGVSHRGEAIIVYNLLAFAGQLPIGMMADILPKKKMLTALGCVLAGISYPLVFVAPWTACVLTAVGNGAFHIGAGTEILSKTMPKAGPSGLFVSSGALGVWLAYRVAGRAFVLLCPVVMLLAAVVLLLIDNSGVEELKPAEIRYGKPSWIVLLAGVCFMLTIVLRSLLGMVMNFSWKAEPVLSLLAVLAVVAGKAVGGVLGDRFGHVKTVTISLLVSLTAFLFSMENWGAGIVAILCFNMTMPLTLTAIARLCRGKYGFAFGLTTFALAMGFIPVVFGANSWFGVPLLTGGSFASLILLILGYLPLKKQKG